MGIKLLASAAVTGLFLAAAVAPPRAAAQEAGLAADSAFIETAGSLALLQVRLGQLAEKKASSSSVREYGTRMAAEYGKLTEDLAAAARQAAFPTPVLLRQHKQIAERFAKMGRSSFDRNYMEETVKAQEEAVQLFQRQSRGGRVQSLKELAAGMLPTVEQHAGLARETARSVGADVTTAASQAQQGS